jgi:type I restriction enzyme S subunit
MELSTDELKSLNIPQPSSQQQRAIADYLDRETARLDALVAAKERVLGLLAEKRGALITRAVTRGLDPDAPLRDSGISWLGKIPAHWERAQLRRFTQFITSGSRGWAEHYADSGSLFIRIGNLTRDSTRLDLTDVQYVDPPDGAEGERTRIQAGDLLFSITAYLGSVAVVPASTESAYVNQHIALARLDSAKGLIPEFAGYVALCELGQAQLVGQGYGGTKTQLALDDIRELWFPVPPVSEQQAIVSRIEHDIAHVERLHSATARTSALLEERRAALIAAAVTGQIDVASSA